VSDQSNDPQSWRNRQAGGAGQDSDQQPGRGAAAAAKAKAGADFVRLRLAQLVWLVCVIAALILAAGALLIALQDSVNRGNDLVQFVLDAADKLDLGVFDRGNGVFGFDGKNAETKDALINWGIAAVVWLVVGKIIDRVIRP
jgi:hypothetical protein